MAKEVTKITGGHASPFERIRKVTPPKPAGQMRRTQTAEPELPTVSDEASLLADLRALIQSARQRVATVANATQTLLYWHVGRRLLKENLQDGRAAYGKRILATVSRELFAEFGEGFSYSSLTRMIRFAETLADEAIVVTLSQQLSWSHFLALLQTRLHQAIEHAREQAARRETIQGRQP